MTDPIAFYGRSEGSSVTGGFVYRGSRSPSFIGRYLYGDFISGRIWSIVRGEDGRWSAPRLELETGLNISTFGEDEAGELYIADYGVGTIRLLRDADAAVSDYNPPP